MERRKTPRFARDEHVRLSLLSADNGPESGRAAADVRIVDASAHGMRIESSLPLRPGALIQIEGQDTLLLGEVLYCQSISEFQHYLGVELTSALYGLADLQRLNRSLIQAAGRESPVRDRPSASAATPST